MIIFKRTKKNPPLVVIVVFCKYSLATLNCNRIGYSREGGAEIFYSIFYYYCIICQVLAAIGGGGGVFKYQRREYIIRLHELCSARSKYIM